MIRPVPKAEKHKRKGELALHQRTFRKWKNVALKIQQIPNQEEKSIIFVEHHTDDLDNSRSSLKTVITDDWKVFQDQQQKSNHDLELIDLFSSPAKNNARINHLVQQNIVELPDLISFLDLVSQFRSITA
ncbi:hypothetical protein L2E82_45738 [Cichorium intybus]|uniref:Uncharacterized protein n=1 Tax=Cichorium intybus TaxID=13427 RepID=A0ACB8ZUS2_CICIN|nr:hypothetical protein L2E82_45738 [Cichorium intybus]